MGKNTQLIFLTFSFLEFGTKLGFIFAILFYFTHHFLDFNLNTLEGIVYFYLK